MTPPSKLESFTRRALPAGLLIVAVSCARVPGAYTPKHAGATTHWNEEGKIVTRVGDVPISRLPLYRYGQLHQAMQTVPSALGYIEEAKRAQDLAYAFGSGAGPVFYGALGTGAASFIDSEERRSTYLLITAGLTVLYASLLGVAYHYSIVEELRAEDAINAYNDAVLGPTFLAPEP